MNVTKTQASAIRAEIEAAIADVLAKHNMTSEVTHGYGDYFKFTLTATPKVEGPNGIDLGTREAQYFMKFGWESYGDGTSGDFSTTSLTASLGTKFKAGKGEYIFAGVDPKKKKYPIMAKDVKDGSTVFLTDAAIKFINAAVA